MKKALALIPVGLAAAAAAVVLAKKKGDAAPKAAGKGGVTVVKPKKPLIETPKTDVYSFASGYKDAKTVEVGFTYNADTGSFDIISEAFLVPTSDSHVAILQDDEFQMQIEYASYYAGDDFEGLKKDVAERFRLYGEVTYNGIKGIKYFNGKSYCLNFPIEGVTADYLLITVNVIGDDTEEEALKLPTKPMLDAVLNSITIKAE